MSGQCSLLVKTEACLKTRNQGMGLNCQSQVEVMKITAWPSMQAHTLMCTSQPKTGLRNCNTSHEAATLNMVRWSCKFAAVIVALSLWGTPLLDCMLRADSLTQQERECCQEMADQCGSSAMPSSHSCCKELPQPNASSIVLVKSKNPCPESVIPQVAGFTTLIFSPLQIALVATHDPPLLKSPPGGQTVLRI